MNKILLFFTLIACFDLVTSTINLTTLSFTQGFTFESIPQFSSATLQGLGDVNADGLDDISLSPAYNVTGSLEYVLYGTESEPSNVNLSTLNSSQGFTISNAERGAYACGVGDVNGDGIDDMMFQSPNVTGTVCLIFGSKKGLPNINMSQCGNDPSTVLFSGVDGPISISGAGDINGDNIQDMIIGGQNAYVVYGNKDGLSNMTLSNLSSTQGFTITAYTGFQRVLGVGDVNGDGLDDIAVGPSYVPWAQSRVDVLYGSRTGLQDINITNLNPNQGFSINYTLEGTYAVDACDINGDGLNDIFFQEISGGYVVYGSDVPEDVSLLNLTESQGLSIITSDKLLYFTQFHCAGDLDKDGFDDLVASTLDYNNQNGEGHIILGSKNLSSTIDVSNLPGNQGCTITGPTDNMYAFSGIGDFNGDGYPDLGVGVAQVNTNPPIAAYVLYSPFSPSFTPQGLCVAKAPLFGLPSFRVDIMIMIILSFIVCLA